MSTNPTTTPPVDRRHAWNDPRGWLALAWVAFWGAAYVHSALGERFPWIRSWIHEMF